MGKKSTQNKITSPNSTPDKGVLPTTKRKLASLSGNKCANPSCHNYLVKSDGSYDIGEAAHIVGEHEGAARFNSNISAQQRNDISNLIFLCANCHLQVDADKEGKTYSVKLLTQWKKEHEEKIQQLVSDGFMTLDFPELEVAVNWLLAQSFPIGIADTKAEKFRLITISEKIQKHKLSDHSKFLIIQACSRQTSVEQFIQEQSKNDLRSPTLPERLKLGILHKYCYFQKQRQSGEILFTSMYDYIKRVSTELPVQCAAISILVYFFEKCDIFSD
ncbi:MAG: HNH endonuclease [Planctomycetaceae bacterium]|jgi:hypothetical protein|nr:HNH endonuclease [Planctomycetaceae bacterium]